jgi:cytoskeletal protein RodZ
MAAQHARGDFGSKLRAARERRGLSLRQISSATKIPMLTLEALERNDLTRLPGGIFSRAFVRAYALEVGLDPDAAIEEFVGEFPQESVTAGHPAKSQVEDHEAVESDRRTATTFLRLVAISVPIAAVVAYFGAAGRKQSAVGGQQPAVSSPQSAVGSPQSAVGSQQSAVSSQESAGGGLQSAASSSQSAISQPAAADSQAVPADRLVVQVSAVRRAWISAIVDGKRAAQREFKPGEDVTFDVQKEIVLTVGDAGGVSVRLNGMPARPLGGDGQVATLRVSPATFKNYVIVP